MNFQPIINLLFLVCFDIFFLFILQKYKNAVRKVCKELTKGEGQEEDQENQLNFDLSVR